ncbi:retinaldehyde-binding protein 1-like isoform X4 [Uranotaenia lowii]|uniref:retinaldehyde-binding protein 1-like isoform X4 n=1 Tax=Uranotaenia lowii TaxID=190385 RepID=UPI00247A3CF7|nr:retinaldehyde-binding protein 1-like isoform X4 [Uranotaenia lowii]
MSTVFSVDKCPARYDSYEGLRDDRLRAKAKDELHEDDNVREVSLAQMREFVAKHPRIVRCRTDAPFLLMFLRARKFNVVAAGRLLESTLTIITQYPQCYKVQDFDEFCDRCIGLGIVVPMGYSPEDHFLIVFQAAIVDSNSMTAAMIMKILYLLCISHGHEDRFQIGGTELVMDFRNISASYLGLWSMTDINILMTMASDAMPNRLKKVHVVGLPSFATILANTCMGMLSEKLKNRVSFHKSIDDLKAAIDESVLPDIYGGKQSLEEANERFRQKVLEQRERILKHAEMTIDLSIPNPNSKNPANAALQSSVVDESVIGSFRKLNVD